MAKLMSKSELIQKIADQHRNNITRKDVKGVIKSLAEIGYKELKKTGAFFVPGFAKFVVIKKPATKERSGINPFTKEPTIFKAKPARKIIRARPVKAAKDAVSRVGNIDGGMTASVVRWTTLRHRSDPQLLARFASLPVSALGLGLIGL